ncbi:MAG: transcriptional regulator, MarR family [Cyanobacteria bacterium RYN_339]|nr:transcriptional regulator, MarR family [Cyanobacteria bacterium RYN_339]
MMKAYRALQRHAEHSIVALGLGLSDFAVLEILLNKGPQKVNDIGRTIGLTSGAITAAVDRLEDQGLLARTSDPGDRRSRIVALTPKGVTCSQDAFASHAAALERAVVALTDEERVTLVALLKKLGLSAQAQWDASKD